jgi:hypothetical protein
VDLLSLASLQKNETQQIFKTRFPASSEGEVIRSFKCISALGKTGLRGINFFHSFFKSQKTSDNT